MPRTRSKSGYDLEEITPNHFIVHSDNAYSVLSGEGDRRGTLFELTSWRREGLLARLAARGYRTLTLDKRIEALPPLSQPQDIGEPAWRTIEGANARYSIFDLLDRDWQALELVEHRGVMAIELRAGQVVRRRKGRGAADYFVVIGERNNGISLNPVDEMTALLTGYAQAAAYNPGSISAQRDGDVLVVPTMLLPQPYREFLRRVADEQRTGWRVTERGWPYVVRLFERLGLALTAK